MSVFLTDIRIALASLRATRIRTALTTLGIIIGVGCITTVIALGDGAKAAIGSQLTTLGGNVVTVRPGQAKRDQGGHITSYNLLAALGATTLTERDYNTLSELPNTKIAPIMLITGSVKNNGAAAPGSQIIATSPDLPAVLNLKVSNGQFLEPNINRNTVVIGSQLADEVFGTQASIGQTLTIRGQEFTVIGVLKRVDSATNLSGFNLNEAAYVRLDAGKGFNQGIAQIQQLLVKPASGASLAVTAQTVQQKLLDNHGGEEDFASLTPADTATIADSTFSFVTAITSAIAAISIIVGGVGIMNIMLVSVTERTHEIGIRKSVGATNRQVLRQFMIEALMMTVTGGVVGVLLAYGAAFLIAVQFGFLPALEVSTIGLALGISVATGVVFGSWPALKAARKDPIDALRQLN